MQSEIRVKGPNIRITIIAGLFLTVTVIVLALVFRFEFSVILLTVGGTLGLTGVVIVGNNIRRIVHVHRLDQLDLEIKRQELRLRTYEADRAGLGAYVLHFSRNERLVVPQDAPVRVIDAITRGDALALLPSTTAPVTLLDVLPGISNGLIVGAPKSGKTTLLLHIIRLKQQVSRVVCLDPHGAPNKYPSGCIVVGTGMNYAEIGRTLDGLLALMKKRYQDIGTGRVKERGHPLLTVVADEWTLLPELVPNAGSSLKALLTQGRKAGIDIFLASHSDRAAALGLKGWYDLIESFAIIRLANINGQFRGTLDYGDGPGEVILPGPFVAGTPALDQGVLDLEPEPSPVEAHVLRLHEDGASYNEIARQVYGSTGGKQTTQIKATLARFGAI